MKKLMIAAAVVCAAAMSQAATIDWSIEYASNPWTDDDILVEDGFAAYFFVDSASLGGEGLYSYDTAVANLEKGDFSFVVGNAIGDPSSFDYGEASKFSVGNMQAGNDSENNVIKAYAIILGKDDEGVDRAFITTYAGTEINKLGGADTILFGDLDAATISTGDAGNWYAAPEPTSGLLLLIGVAGLALRRRRA